MRGHGHDTAGAVISQNKMAAKIGISGRLKDFYSGIKKKAFLFHNIRKSASVCPAF